MTDVTTTTTVAGRRSLTGAALVAKRYRAERRFRSYGIAALAIATIFLIILFADILTKGIPAFFEHTLTLKLTAEQSALDPNNTKDPRVIAAGDFDGLIRAKLRDLIPEATTRAERKK